MVDFDYDVVVIGGGPGGSALATLVAQRGHRVALFEKQSFPRFQVGESLVPSVNLTLERLGVTEQMDKLGFTRKEGVQFYSPAGPTKPFYFDEVADPRMHHTWQVLRSEFDQMLFENAARHGAVARTETEVKDLIEDGERTIGVRVANADGSTRDIHARVVVDATGQNGVVARRHGGRKLIEGLKNASVFAHFDGVRRDTGRDAGSTLIYRVDAKTWLWFIPLRDAVSIGVVTPAHNMSSLGSSPEAVLKEAIRRCPDLADRTANAQRVTDIRAVRDFSYRTENDGGRGWLLVGDAVGFIDPIYSTGLCLTMVSAELGAAAILDAFAQDAVEPNFAGYSAEYQQAFDQFLYLVRAYYEEDFHFGSLAMDPSHRQGLVDLLTGVVGTPEAADVTRTIQTFFEKQMML